jgi:hypothetical protein
VALGIFALVAVAILGVDISRMLVARVQLQNAADAGALAGARMFLDSPIPSDVEIRAEAEDIAGMNKAFAAQGDEVIPAANIDVSVNMTDQIVRVTTRSLVSQYFLGVTNLGIDAGDVAAVAAARVNEVCNSVCMKPWSIPDRHDDQTLIPGYPEWQNNGIHDKEEFTDLDDNNFWNPGEPYVDDNSDGVYNQEFYHPLFTGYTAAKDHGLQLTLKSGNFNKPEPGQYFPVDLPDENGDYVPGGAQYRWNIWNCNPNSVKPGDLLKTENGNMVGPTAQGMRQLYDKDPNAHWDDGCSCVADSDFSSSPRIGLIPLHDPRVPLRPGKMDIHVVKIAAFFIEEIRGNGVVVGRFLKIQGPGDPCPDGQTAGGFVWNLSLIE